jgi:hypothetical protein
LKTRLGGCLVLATASLLALADGASAMEIRYDRGPLSTDIGNQDTFDQGSSAPATSDFRGRMSFGMTMQYVTLIDSSGTIATVIAGAGAAAAAESKANAENNKSSHPSSTISYSYIVKDLRGTDSGDVSLRFGWGSSAGGTYGGQALTGTANSAWTIALGAGAPIPIIENFLDFDINFNLGYTHFGVTGLPITSGTDKHTFAPPDPPIEGYIDPSYTENYRTEANYSAGSLEAPFMFGLTCYPLPFLAVHGYGGYDPVTGLVGVLIGKGGYPRQPFYYGASANTVLFSHLRLEGGYKVSKVNIGFNRALDEALTYGSAGLTW